MANRSKQKGDRAELQVQEQLSMIPGVQCKRIGLSSQAGLNGEKIRGDLLSEIAGLKMVWEVKARKGNTGYKKILDWLSGVDALALKVDGSVRPVVVLGWETFEDLVRGLVNATGTENLHTVVEDMERGNTSGFDADYFG